MPGDHGGLWHLLAPIHHSAAVWTKIRSAQGHIHQNVGIDQNLQRLWTYLRSRYVNRGSFGSTRGTLNLPYQRSVKEPEPSLRNWSSTICDRDVSFCFANFLACAIALRSIVKVNFSFTARVRYRSHVCASRNVTGNQNGISSSSGAAGADGFGGALVLAPPVCRSSPAASAAPAPLGRPPSNCMLSPTTRSFVRFCPVCLSSQVSICKRPSMKTGRPFFRYSPAISARRAHSTTSTKVTSSRFSPLSVV